MDKRKVANLRVRKSITDALFELMQKKPITDISITEIIRKAEVARVSFYRNYESKEDVLVGLVRDALDDYRETADYDLKDFFSMKNIVRVLEYYLRYGSYVLNLHRSGYASMLLEEINQFQISVAGDMPMSSSSRYRLYAFAGGMYNTAIYWLNEVNPAPAEEIARVILDSVMKSE